MLTVIGMTCIEFFDNNAIENIFTCLALKPDRVILMGGDEELLLKHAQRYKAFTDEKGMNVEFAYSLIERNDVDEIVDVLADIVNTYDECVIDLTGGGELYLAAAGVIRERFSFRDIQMHHVDYISRTSEDVDGDGCSVTPDVMPKLSVEDCIKLYGGKVVSTGETLFRIGTDLVGDVNALWDICRKDPYAWNKMTHITSAGKTDERDPLRMHYEGNTIKNKCAAENIEYGEFQRFLSRLRTAKMIRTSFDASGYHIAFKNDVVMNCLTVSGRTFELQIYNAARNYIVDGDLFYNDVVNGIVMKWDDALPATPDPMNEIDVMMIKGTVPVFVSCKNGQCGSDELYKLNTVAMRFGGKYSRKVLALSNPASGNIDSLIRQRADEMGILLFENMRRLDYKGIEEEVGKFWDDGNGCSL